MQQELDNINNSVKKVKKILLEQESFAKVSVFLFQLSRTLTFGFIQQIKTDGLKSKIVRLGEENDKLRSQVSELTKRKMDDYPTDSGNIKRETK